MIFFGIPLNWLPWPKICAFVEYPYGSLHELDWKQGPASKFTYFHIWAPRSLCFFMIFFKLFAVFRLFEISILTITSGTSPQNMNASGYLNNSVFSIKLFLQASTKRVLLKATRSIMRFMFKIRKLLVASYHFIISISSHLFGWVDDNCC